MKGAEEKKIKCDVKVRGVGRNASVRPRPLVKTVVCHPRLNLQASSYYGRITMDPRALPCRTTIETLMMLMA